LVPASKVTGRNEPTAHTVTFDDGSADSGNLAPGSTFDHTFATAGTFAYHCAIHSSMHGTVTVTP
jgi:plastocyanin